VLTTKRPELRRTCQRGPSQLLVRFDGAAQPSSVRWQSASVVFDVMAPPPLDGSLDIYTMEPTPIGDRKRVCWCTAIRKEGHLALPYGWMLIRTTRLGTRFSGLELYLCSTPGCSVSLLTHLLSLSIS